MECAMIRGMTQLLRKAWLPAVLAIASCAATAQAAQPVARITDTTGAVSVRHSEQWQAITKAPVELFDGDKVNTDRGRANILFLGDESTVVLDVGTNITIHQPASFGSSGFVRRVEIYVGDLWFKMTKGATQHTDLATPTAVGGLRGTEGAVHVESNEQSSFTLKEGALEISRTGGEQGANAAPVQLHGGETLQAVRGQAFTPTKATAMPIRPDVKVAADKLPEPNPNRLSSIKSSEKPGKVSGGEATGESGKNAGESGSKSKPAKPAKTPKPPPKRKP